MNLRPNNGSKIRVYNLINYLAQQHTVDLISFTTENVSQTQVETAQAHCRRVEHVPYVDFNPTRIKALLGFFSPTPRSRIDTHSRVFENKVLEAGRKNNYDVVIASEVDTVHYATALKNVPKIFEGLEVTTWIDQVRNENGSATKFRKKLGWWKYTRYLRKQLRLYDGCTVVSEAERENVQQIYPGYPNVQVIPNGVDVSHYVNEFGQPEPDTMIYSGAMTYFANFDAMDYFLREIFPLIAAKRPNAKLYITGKTGNVPVERLPAYKNVVFTGYLDDIRPAVARSWCSVVPLQLGSGTRLKILEALALGSPVVSTTKGAEGLHLEPERDILIADDPPAFAQAVLRLMDDPALRKRLNENGRKTVVTRYDWGSICQQFTHFVEEVARTGK